EAAQSYCGAGGAMSNYRLLPPADKAIVKAIVARFQKDKGLIRTILAAFVAAMDESDQLKPHVHSIRHRIKEDSHLQDKLARKLIKARSGEPFAVTPDTLLEEIYDLFGVRILHLHSRQIVDIDAALKSLFAQHQYTIE